jgi:protein-disulfide isomerase
MKRSIALLSLALFLTACVDTTGVNPESTKKPRGNPNASVVITEYGDFQCPACRVAHAILTKPILQKYGEKVRLDFKQFPLLTIHPLSMPIAEASECAADQGKFWEFVDTAYGEQLKMDQERKQATAQDITAWAQSLGLDMDLFNRCTQSHLKRKPIMAEFEEGRKIDVNGTPSFFVNGKKVDNDMASFTKAIDDALKGGGSAAPAL